MHDMNNSFINPVTIMAITSKNICFTFFYKPKKKLFP